MENNNRHGIAQAPAIAYIKAPHWFLSFIGDTLIVFLIAVTVKVFVADIVGYYHMWVSWQFGLPLVLAPLAIYFAFKAIVSRAKPVSEQDRIQGRAMARSRVRVASMALLAPILVVLACERLDVLGPYSFFSLLIELSFGPAFVIGMIYSAVSKHPKAGIIYLIAAYASIAAMLMFAMLLSRSFL
jgi:hypothetical protein